MSVLSRVKLPKDLKKLSFSELQKLNDELRDYTIEIVSKTGGHLGASLGVVELTVALHYVFNTPSDKLIWDVRHHTYPHKILTGRKNKIINKINNSFDLIYFSAGFDAHKLDPLASINLQNEDFYWVTKIVLEKLANNVPIISVLEGGYDMKGLLHGLNNHLKALIEYSNE